MKYTNNKLKSICPLKKIIMMNAQCSYVFCVCGVRDGSFLSVVLVGISQALSHDVFLTQGFILSLKPKDDLYPLLHPTMHCWTPTSDLYIGCEEGHLLMINGDTLKVTVLNKIEEESPLGEKLSCFIFPYSHGCWFCWFSLYFSCLETSLIPPSS